MEFPTITPERIRAGEFPRLHCTRCDWPWKLHQPDAPPLSRIHHEFEFDQTCRCNFITPVCEHEESHRARIRDEFGEIT